MKKLISILLTFVLLLSVIIVPAYADNNVQKIYGRIVSIDAGSSKYIIKDETGNLIEASATEGLELSFSIGYALFTIETLTDEEGEYQCITCYEIIPEVGEEVGYYCYASTYWNNYSLHIYTNEMIEAYTASYTKINGTTLTRDNASELLKNRQGAVSFKVNEDNRVEEMTFITEPKMSIKDQKYNTEKQTFDGLEYPITENTNILYMIKNENKFTGFDSEYTYSFDVASYDKNKNARLIIITDMYKYGMEFYTAYNDDYCYTKNENGNTNRWDSYDSSLFDDISANSMIEFTYNENDGIKSAKVVENTDFQGSRL